MKDNRNQPARKRVAVLNSTSVTYSYGGVSPFVRNLDPFLREAYEVSYFNLPDAIEKIDFLPRRLLFFIYVLVQAPRLRKHDFIFSHTPEGSYVVSFFGVPYLHIFHGNFNAMTQSRFWFGKYFKWVFDLMERRILKTAALKYTVGKVRNGVPKILNPIYHQVRLKSAQEKSGFIFAGRLEKIKNIDKIIRVYAQLPAPVREQHSLYIAGFGSQEGSLRALAESLGIATKVFFLGNLDNADLLEECSKHKILLMASSQEGFPMAIAEAFSLANPVVATDTGDISSFLKSNYNGFLLPVEFDDKDYLNSVLTILDNYDTFSANALESAQVFNARNVTAALILDIDQCLSHKQ